MKKLAICALLVLAFSTAAFADTQIATDLFAGYTFSASSGNFSGSLTFTNTSTTQSDIVIAWALNLFAGSSPITGASFDAPLVTGWEIFYGTTPGNDGSPCGTSGNGGNICADGFVSRDLPFTPGVIPANGSLTFYFSGTYDDSKGTNLGDFHLQANGCYDADADSGWTSSEGSNGPTVDCADNNKWAYSSPISAHTTPEPATLTLLGAGLLGLAGLTRRKK